MAFRRPRRVRRAAPLSVTPLVSFTLILLLLLLLLCHALLQRATNGQALAGDQSIAPRRRFSIASTATPNEAEAGAMRHQLNHWLHSDKSRRRSTTPNGTRHGHTKQINNNPTHATPCAHPLEPMPPRSSSSLPDPGLISQRPDKANWLVSRSSVRVRAA